MYNTRLDTLLDYPFSRLRTLLEGTAAPAGVSPLALSVGEPQHQPPVELINAALIAGADTWNRYPPVPGTDDFRLACTEWLNRRYHLAEGYIDPASMVLPLAGSREGLFMAALLAVPENKAGYVPAVLMPDLLQAQPSLVHFNWSYGHLLNFNGLTRTVLLVWPLLAAIQLLLLFLRR